MIVLALALNLVLVRLEWYNQLAHAFLSCVLKRGFHILLVIRTLQSIVSVAGLP
jgi:hypothetical protein